MIMFVWKKWKNITKKKCNKVNCFNLINVTEKYCDDHKQLDKQSKRFHDKQRYSNNKEVRQTYSNKTWKSIRDNTLIRDSHMCLYCQYKGIWTAATMVDHFIPVRDAIHLRYVASNLVSCCGKCNTRKAFDEYKLRTKQITFDEFKMLWNYTVEWFNCTQCITTIELYKKII